MAIASCCSSPAASLVGNAGVLLTRVLVPQAGGQKNFGIVDAAMNDLSAPGDVRGLARRSSPARSAAARRAAWDVVGPVCESGDWLGRDRALVVAPGDRLAVLSAGAYAMAMASNYNSRPRAAEVMVDGPQVHLIRERESVRQLFAGERLIEP